jgi:hypothetical protein
MAKLEIGPAMLWRLGYRNLTRQQVADALKEIYEALELAVGTRLAARMNDRQLTEFEKLMATGIEERAVAWLGETMPDYRQVVADEFDILQRRLEGAISLARRQQRELNVESENE